VDGSLLTKCLFDGGDIDKDFKVIDDIEELVECCEYFNDEVFDKDCEDSLEDAQLCLTECLDPCIQETSTLYLDCIDDNSGSSSCEATECFDELLSGDLEDDIDIDLEDLADNIGQLEVDDLEDCDSLEDFVDSVCDIGKDCCKKCNSELAGIVDCLINDVIIPFVAAELNVTVNECPIDLDKCELIKESGDKMRDLKEREEEVFTQALSLPKRNAQTKRDKLKEKFVEQAKNRRLEGETSDDKVAACQATMKSDIIATNMTYATNQYMECVTSAALGALEDAPESGAPAAFKIGALVAALVGSFLAL
jgi:hypothetical protein